MRGNKSRLIPANLFTRCASTWVGEKKMGTFTMTDGYDSEQQESAPRFFPGAAKTTDASPGSRTPEIRSLTGRSLFFLRSGERRGNCIVLQ